MKAHIIIPEQGVRLFNQTKSEAIETVKTMGRHGDDIVFVVKAGVPKKEILQALKQIEEYVKKDF